MDVTQTRKHPKTVIYITKKRRGLKPYPCYWFKDAALWVFVPVEEGTRDHDGKPHGHGTCRHTKPNVHSRPRLDPNEDSEGNELPYTEAEIGHVEVSGELLGLSRVIFPELVSSM